MIKIARVELEGVSPYSQSRFHDTPKKEQESHEAYRDRTWREHLHVDENGMVFIPPMSIKNCLSLAAKRLGMKVTGRGAKTYAGFFTSGILVTDPVPLGIKAEDVPGEKLFLPADGKAGSGSRVTKIYPRIEKWKGTATVLILDQIITEKVFAKHMEEAGRYVGLGRFRPERGGFYGRFKVNSIEYQETE
jgi:hypothetical protein